MAETKIPPMLLIMGVTGAGKSHFINNLSGFQAAETSDSLVSCTSTVQGIPSIVGNTRVLLIDTPGFDDTYRTDAEIFKEISEALCAQDLLGVELRGVIFLHNIMNNKYTHSSMKTLSIFNKICGADALKNVVLTTTHWDTVNEADGARREAELSTKIWSNMLSCGAKMARYYGDKGSAMGIASQLLSKESIILELQKEIREGRQLKETAAGALVSQDIDSLRAEYREEIRLLEESRQLLLDNDRVLRQQMQQEWREERARLEALQQKADSQEVILEQKPANEVGQAMSKRSKLAKFSKFIPLLGPVIGVAFDILGMFIGFPMGGTMLTSLFSL